MIILNVRNVETDIVGNTDGSIFQSNFIALRQKLSYRPEGYMFSPKYKTRQWDGWKRLMWKNSRRCYFPTGLLSLVKEFFKEKDIQYKIVDCRHKPEKNIDLSLNTKKYTTRDYQQRVIDTSVEKCRGIIMCSTGAGKTFISAGIIEKCSVKPFLFLVTSIDLLEQSREKLEDALLCNGQKLKVGTIGGGVVDIRDINVMTVQTAVRALGKKFVKFDSESKDDDKMSASLLKKHRSEIVNLIKSSKGMICDECVAGDTLIRTKEGKIRIDELENHIGKELLTFDGTDVVWKKITHFYKKGKQKVLKIELSNGNFIKCTKEHPIMTNRGWIVADKIVLGDFILCSNQLNTNYSMVDCITNDGEEEVYDITVEDTHCFFANDILVHNCQHWRADICQIVTNAAENAYYKWGSSATPYRDNGDDLLIQSCFGKNICEINASELIQKNFLVKPKITFVHLNPPPSKFKNWQNIYKERIVEDEYYNTLVANIANEYLKSNKTVLVLIQQIEHGKTLEPMIDGALFIYGDSAKKERVAALEKMRNGYIKCLISSVILDEGVDLCPLDTLILAGGGKCLSNRSMIQTGSGLLTWDEIKKNIDMELIKEDEQIKIQKRFKIDAVNKKSSVSHFYYGGKQHCKKIVLYNGLWIEGTDSHRIRVLRDGRVRWSSLDRVLTTDRVLIKKGSFLFGKNPPFKKFTQNKNARTVNIPKKMNPTLSRLIGYCLTEGNMTEPRSFSIANVFNGDCKQFDEFGKEFNAPFIQKLYKNRRGPENEENGWHYRCCRKNFIEFLRSIGVEKVCSRYKTIPACIRTASFDCISTFLSAVFDGESHVCHNGIDILMSSEKFIRVLQLMLLNIGITSYLSVKVALGKDYWRLRITNSNNLSLFKKYIGFCSPSKSKKLDKLIRKYNPNKNNIPGIKEICRTIRSQTKKERSTALHKKISGCIVKLAPSSRQDFTHNSLREFLDFYDDVESRQTKYLRLLCNPNIEFVSIKEILNTSLCDVYDFTVPESYYVAQGTISHNSPTRAMQRIGRTLRPFKNKTEATVIDFFIHEKYLEEHAKAREKMYKTEPEFEINHIFAD